MAMLLISRPSTRGGSADAFLGYGVAGDGGVDAAGDRAAELAYVDTSTRVVRFVIFSTCCTWLGQALLSLSCVRVMWRGG